MPYRDGFVFNSPNLNRAHAFFIDANCHYAPHSHPYHELVVIQKGRLRSRVNKTEQIGESGDVFLYPKGVTHEEWAEDEQPVLTYVCMFDLPGLNLQPLFCHDAYGRIQGFIAKFALESAFSNNLTISPERKHHYLKLILTEIEHLVTTKGPQAIVDKVRAYIYVHIRESFSLNDLIAVSGIGKSHLMRQYRAITGRTPMEDARFLRIAEARRLLMSTKVPLHEIGPMVGIPDACRLSRLIKSTLGVNARDLRHSAVPEQSVTEDPN